MKDELFNITLDNLSGSMMLTIEPKGKVVINEFCCEMIKKTNVFGILKLNVTTINGETKFNYDLSKKVSMPEFAKGGFNESYGKRILYNLCMVFLKLNEYYLKPNYCLLNTDYTYIGDGLNVYLPYIPIKDATTDPSELKDYFLEVLNKYFAVAGTSAYDEMFKYVYQCQTLDLSHFISKFLASEEQNQNNFMAEKQERMANKMPLPNANQPQMPNQAPPTNMQMPVNQNVPKPNVPNQNVKPQGFKLPGIGAPKMNSEPKAPGVGAMNIPGGGGLKMPGGGEFRVPGGSQVKMQGTGNAQQPQNIEKKGLFGLGGKKPIPSPIPAPNPINKPNSVPNIPNQQAPNFNQFNVPQNNQMQNNFNPVNVPPKFPNGFQGSMDKTIMIDGMHNQSQNMNIGSGGTAYLQYRGQNIPINDSEFVIGKANSQYKVNFVIADNPHVSRKHATIIMQGNSYFIRDEGSTNGTFVNGRSLPKMVPQPLQNGDEISIYDEVFRFCM